VPPVELAVVTAAGRGTRMLPATRTLQKELLTVVDRPALEYVFAEIAECPIPHAFVAVGDHHAGDVRRFVERTELPALAAPDGDPGGPLERLRVTTSKPLPPMGLGYAVLEARAAAASGAFAVLLGDNIIPVRVPVLRTLVSLHTLTSCSVVALTRIRPETSELYGCAVVSGTERDGVVAVGGLVEKPRPADAPSNLGVIGRYVLTPAIFDILESLEPDRNGEVQLTDALDVLARRGTLLGVVFDDAPYDIGTRVGLVDATIAIALERPDLAPQTLEAVSSRLRAAGPHLVDR
jgi:UTP--glucose-1-phosphate uridylyltransferase